MKEVKLYLPLEIDFIHSDMHSELIERYSAHGLGIYFMVLMELRNHEAYRCGLSTIKGAARRCLADPEMLESVLCDFGLFEFHQCGDRTVISSPYVDRVMQPFDEKTGRSSSTVNKKTATVERPVYGVSTVTHREIINITKIKTKTTTNKKAASAAKVVDADVAVGVNELNPETATSQPTKLWMEVLANFTRQNTPSRKHVVGLPQQHDKQAKKRSPYRFVTVYPLSGKQSYFGNIIPKGTSPPSHYDGEMRSARIGQWIQRRQHSAQMQPSFGANAIGIWPECNKHLVRMQ